MSKKSRLLSLAVLVTSVSIHGFFPQGARAAGVYNPYPQPTPSSSPTPGFQNNPSWDSNQPQGQGSCGNPSEHLSGDKYFALASAARNAKFHANQVKRECESLKSLAENNHSQQFMNLVAAQDETSKRMDRRQVRIDWLKTILGYATGSIKASAERQLDQLTAHQEEDAARLKEIGVEMAENGYAEREEAKADLCWKLIKEADEDLKAKEAALQDYIMGVKQNSGNSCVTAPGVSG